MGRAILTFMKVYDKVENVQMVIRSDWGTKNGERTAIYLNHHKELPIIRDQTKDVPHGDIRNIYANCDALIITSKAGGFELQSIEAQACGVIPLVNNWTFMNETVVDEQSGFLVDIENTTTQPDGRIWGNVSVDELAKCMVYCVENQEKIKSMGIWARKYVQETYDWKTIADILYQEMGFA